MLLRKVLQVESQVRWPINGEVRPDAPAMLSNGSDEQAHWSRNSVALVGPLTPGSGATGGAGVHVRRCAVDGDGTEDTTSLIGGDDTLESIKGPGVLCKDPPRKLEAAKENLAARLQIIASGKVEGHRVG